MAEANAAQLVRQVHLLEARVGAHTLLFDPQEVLAVEPEGDQIEDDVIVRIDLREWLVTKPTRPRGDCLLVAGEASIYRLVVCAVRQLVQSDVRALHRIPAPLGSLARRLGLGGLVTLADGRLAYLADPCRLAGTTRLKVLR
ncbi:MAG: hypothetical protein AB7N76_14810 [Planctomycetota bacterium]